MSAASFGQEQSEPPDAERGDKCIIKKRATHYQWQGRQGRLGKVGGSFSDKKEQYLPDGKKNLTTAQRYRRGLLKLRQLELQYKMA